MKSECVGVIRILLCQPYKLLREKGVEEGGAKEKAKTGTAVDRGGGKFIGTVRRKLWRRYSLKLKIEYTR